MNPRERTAVGLREVGGYRGEPPIWQVDEDVIAGVFHRREQAGQ